MGKLLLVDNLSKVFKLHLLGGREVVACRNISFGVNEGEALGIKGPSGAGKTTILKCLYRTYLPSSGTAVYASLKGEVDLLNAPEQSILELRRQEIGYVAQFLRVIPRVSALQIVAEELLLKGWDCNRALAEARRLFTHLRLPRELWDASPYTFSGGEQQRVNVARAAAKQPRLLLLDEPTASLDLESKERVRELMLWLKNAGTALVVVSHDQEILQQVADRIIFLDYPAQKQGEEACSHVRDAYR